MWVRGNISFLGYHTQLEADLVQSNASASLCLIRLLVCWPSSLGNPCCICRSYNNSLLHFKKWCREESQRSCLSPDFFSSSSSGGDPSHKFLHTFANDDSNSVEPCQNRVLCTAYSTGFCLSQNRWLPAQMMDVPGSSCWQVLSLSLILCCDDCSEEIFFKLKFHQSSENLFYFAPVLVCTVNWFFFSHITGTLYLLFIAGKRQ